MPAQRSPFDRRKNSEEGKQGQVPAVREVAAVLCSDIHLSHRPPVARSAEPDWYAAMARSLHQIHELIKQHNCPLIIAGDIFDKWNPPVELVNWALLHIPRCYAVPGQHDLPNHSYKEIKRSAYWTLCEVGLVQNLEPGVPVETTGKTPLCLHGFPFGFPVNGVRDPHDMMIEVAVVHQYVWTERKPSTKYHGASDDQELCSLQRQLTGYDVAVFGDNHKGFKLSKKSPQGMSVINCGGLMRRKSDEINYKPSIGLLHPDGTVSRHYLDTEEDKFVNAEKLVAAALKGSEMLDFVEELKGLGDKGIDFRDAVQRALQKENADEETRRIVLEAMDK